MTEEQKSFKQIVEYRKEKLEKLISKGVNPYPSLFKPTHKSSEVILNFDALNNSSLHLAGRIISMRKMGKACFCHIQDESQKIQIIKLLALELESNSNMKKIINTVNKISENNIDKDAPSLIGV